MNGRKFGWKRRSHFDTLFGNKIRTSHVTSCSCWRSVHSQTSYGDFDLVQSSIRVLVDSSTSWHMNLLDSHFFRGPSLQAVSRSPTTDWLNSTLQSWLQFYIWVWLSLPRDDGKVFQLDWCWLLQGGELDMLVVVDSDPQCSGNKPVKGALNPKQRRLWQRPWHCH
ncbi:hypothetical protein BDR22DRAFT_4848 [Usnea florida]